MSDLSTSVAFNGAGATDPDPENPDPGTPPDPVDPDPEDPDPPINQQIKTFINGVIINGGILN